MGNLPMLVSFGKASPMWDTPTHLCKESLSLQWFTEELRRQGCLLIGLSPQSRLRIGLTVPSRPLRSLTVSQTRLLKLRSRDLWNCDAQ
jgi:hypothetical protein